VPTASPFAVSYFSLPKHWELFREVQACQPAQSLLPGGTFEPGGGEIPLTGIPVEQMPGWVARFGTLDRVDVAAGVVPSAKLEDLTIPKPKAPPLKMFGASRPIALPGDDYKPPAPELGRGVLKLEVRLRGEVGKDGKPVSKTTHPLERTFLVVESPPVRVPPGSLVRISGWVKIPSEIRLTADGVLFYDDIGGEPLGVRLLSTDGGKWKQFHLYRRVPASGQVSLSVALTGVGVAYFDDLRVEPLVPNAATSGAAPKAAPAGPRVPAPVQPAGGVRPR
jgi:hypothetical protein